MRGGDREETAWLRGKWCNLVLVQKLSKHKKNYQKELKDKGEKEL